MQRTTMILASVLLLASAGAGGQEPLAKSKRVPHVELRAPVEWKKTISDRELKEIVERYKSGPFEGSVLCTIDINGKLEDCLVGALEPRTLATQRAVLAVTQHLIFKKLTSDESIISKPTDVEAIPNNFRVDVIFDDGYPSRCPQPNGCKWLSGGIPTPPPPPPPPSTTNQL